MLGAMEATEARPQSRQLNLLPTKLKSELMHKLDQCNTEPSTLQQLARKLGLPQEQSETINCSYDFISVFDTLPNSATLRDLHEALINADLQQVSQPIADLDQDEPSTETAGSSFVINIAPNAVVPNLEKEPSPPTEPPQVVSMDLDLLQSSRPHAHVVYCKDAHFSKSRKLLLYLLRENGFELSETKIATKNMLDGSMWATINSGTRFRQVDYVLICLTPCHFKILPKMKSIFPSNESSTAEDMKKSVIGVLFTGKPKPYYEAHSKTSRPRSLYVCSARKLVKRLLPLTYEAPNEYKSLLFYMVQRHKMLKRNQPVSSTEDNEPSSSHTNLAVSPPPQTPGAENEQSSLIYCREQQSPGSNTHSVQAQQYHSAWARHVTTRRQSESNTSVISTSSEAVSSESERSPEMEDFGNLGSQVSVSFDNFGFGPMPDEDEEEEVDMDSYGLDQIMTPQPLTK